MGQIRGSKKVHFFPPSEFHKLCPYPRGHPYDRGSRIRDIKAIPKHCRSLSNAKDGLVATIHPGDVLFLPFGWWHHVETLDGDTTDLPMTFTVGWTMPWIFELSAEAKLRNEHDLMRKRLEAERILTCESRSSSPPSLPAEPLARTTNKLNAYRESISWLPRPFKAWKD